MGRNTFNSQKVKYYDKDNKITKINIELVNI